jgi:death on curing protein
LENEPRWLTIDELIEFNRLAVEQTGEPFSIRDQSMLESAWAKPQNYWHYGQRDVATLAAQLLLGIARDHPFEQGNKRTAFTAADAFLFLNGYSLDLKDHTELAALIIQVIIGEVSDERLIEVFAWSMTAIEE